MAKEMANDGDNRRSTDNGALAAEARAVQSARLETTAHHALDLELRSPLLPPAAPPGLPAHSSAADVDPFGRDRSMKHDGNAAWHESQAAAYSGVPPEWEGTPRAAASPLSPDANPENAATSEFRLPEAAAAVAPRHLSRYVALLLGVLAVVALAAVGLPGASTADGSLRVESEPRGEEVRINGEPRGQTPLVLPLAPGDYSVTIGTGAQAQERRVTLWAGERASIYHVVPPPPIVTPSPPVAPVTVGALSIVTEPAGGAVNIDGRDRGAAPLVVKDLEPGEHRLLVRSRGTVYRRTVVVEAGATSTVVIGAGAAATAAGWLAVQVPLPVQIHEGGRLLGTTASDGLMLLAGEHVLAFSDETSGFRATRTVQITAGETTSITLDVPRAPVNVNATPWAEVWIDNQRVGETPIGNYMVPVGTHQVELRHPQLGTKRLTLPVGLNKMNRLAVDMRER